MDAMILAAGLGERMRPLTNTLPKPLLMVGDIPLIEHHIRKLQILNIKRLVINVSYLYDLIIDYLGDGRRFDLEISYSVEPGRPLGTAGGVINALDLFSSEEILIVNSDIYTDFRYEKLKIPSESWAHLVMVDNPREHPQGDFMLVNGRISLPHNCADKNLTFAGIGIYRKALFESIPPGESELGDIFKRLIRQDKISGEYSNMIWIDAGTPDRLQEAEKLHQKIISGGLPPDGQG